MTVDPTERALLERVEARGDRLLAGLKELVSIPTVNPYSGDDSAGSEAAGQDWVADRLAGLGAQVRRVPVPQDVYERGGVIGPTGRSWQGRENVVGEWVVGDGSGPCILLNDHMDTVGTAGMRIAPFDPVVKDGRVYGRGTSDTKGNVNMGLVAVEALLGETAGLSGRIVFESVVDEECNGGGAGTLACCLAGVAGDFAICLDGSSGRLCNGCGGVLTARVSVEGRAGHAALAGTVNAIDKAIAAKAAIDVFAGEHRAAFPGMLVSVGIFRAGTLPAIVPGEAEIQLNISYDIAEAREAEKAEGAWDGRTCRRRFEKAIAGLAGADEWFADRPAQVEWIKDLPPFFCDPEAGPIRVALEAVGEIDGAPAEPRPMTAWFDAAHLARRLHVPALGMGYGTPGCAHGPDEYVLLADLQRGAGAVALTLHRLLRAR